MIMIHVLVKLGPMIVVCAKFLKTMVSKLLLQKCQSATTTSNFVRIPQDCRSVITAGTQQRSPTSCSRSEILRISAVSVLGFQMDRQPERDQGLGKLEKMGNAARKPEALCVGKTEHESVGKAVGKSENEDVSKSVGKSENEGVGKSVGKSENESVGKSVGKSENESVGKSVGKSESVGKSVGKSENESVGKSVGKSESVGKSVGKSENESVGKSVGKSENESVGKSVGKSESVGKSVGKSENESVGKSVGKSESVGKSVGKSENESVGKSVGKSENEKLGKSVGEAENESVGKAVGKAENQKPVHNQASSPAKREFVITVAGQPDVESFASELKLPEGATLVAARNQAEEEEEKEFRVGLFLDLLTTKQFGRLVFHARQLPSTHTFLSQNCKVLPVGTLSVADVQFQGKGRAGNLWESPKGCLMFSFTVHMSDGRAVPFLQYVVSLAIIEGIEELCTTIGLQAPGVRIKWPNDLYADGLKVGGVLCTSTYSSKKFNIVIGVGLNVSNRQPTTCLDALLEGINEKVPYFGKDELLANIISQFEDLFEVFCSQGFSALESNYYKRWLHSNQTVVLEEKHEGSTDVSHIPMKIQGLTPTGYLRAIDDANETYELHPDGNSFDFLKGLVRQKI